MRHGRPLRFLALSLTAWTGTRAVLLWPVASAIEAIADLVSFPEAAAAMLAIAAPPDTPSITQQSVTAPTPAPTPHRPPAAREAPAPMTGQAAALAHEPAPIAPPVFMPASARAPNRLAGSVWLLARGGQSTGLLGGQLGASQAGARVTYALGRARKLALSARIAAPLRGRGKEAAIGFDWQPLAAAIHVIAEQRIALDGGRGGPALFAVGGVGPTEIARGVLIEAYAQVGIVKRGAIQSFGDGSARVSHRLVDLGTAQVHIGAGAWGGAQPGVARVDIGPSISVATEAAGKPIRLTLDWRERVAGSARPGSGPAVSIGSDF